jgi:hypothetical protein
MFSQSRINASANRTARQWAFSNTARVLIDEETYADSLGLQGSAGHPELACFALGEPIVREREPVETRFGGTRYKHSVRGQMSTGAKFLGLQLPLRSQCHVKALHPYYSK